MSNGYSSMELWKYPVIVGSIVIGLLLADWWLGIDMSRVVEVGPNGLRLAEVREDAASAAASLEARLDEAMARIAELEASTAEPDTPRIEPIRETNAPSDAVARLSRATDESGTLLKGKRGWTWIGDYDPETDEWEKPNLLQLDDGIPYTGKMTELSPGRQFRIARNMYLRAGRPEDDSDYFKGQEPIGVVQEQTRLTLRSEPQPIRRGSRTQYWAEVEVAE